MDTYKKFLVGLGVVVILFSAYGCMKMVNAYEEYVEQHKRELKN